MITLLSLISTLSFAAIPQQNALELLSLPNDVRLERAMLKKNEIYPSLIEVAFSDGNSLQTRWKALNLAAQINPVESQSEIKRALQHKDWFMKNAALTALKEVSPIEAHKAAFNLLSDKALVVRSMAVQMLNDDLSLSERKSLWNALDSKQNKRKGQSLWVRQEILDKLAMRPDQSELKKFGTIIKENNKELNSIAINALEKISKFKLGTIQSSDQQKRILWISYLKKNKIL